MEWKRLPGSWCYGESKKKDFCPRIKQKRGKKRESIPQRGTPLKENRLVQEGEKSLSGEKEVRLPYRKARHRGTRAEGSRWEESFGGRWG